VGDINSLNMIVSFKIHMVHWKRDDETPSPDVAAEAEDGLMAVGVFFDVRIFAFQIACNNCISTCRN